jgi:hypothetical protein
MPILPADQLAQARAKILEDRDLAAQGPSGARRALEVIEAMVSPGQFTSLRTNLGRYFLPAFWIAGQINSELDAAGVPDAGITAQDVRNLAQGV